MLVSDVPDLDPLIDRKDDNVTTLLDQLHQPLNLQRQNLVSSVTIHSLPHHTKLDLSNKDRSIRSINLQEKTRAEDAPKNPKRAAVSSPLKVDDMLNGRQLTGSERVANY